MVRCLVIQALDLWRSITGAIPSIVFQKEDVLVMESLSVALAKYEIINQKSKIKTSSSSSSSSVAAATHASLIGEFVNFDLALIGLENWTNREEADQCVQIVKLLRSLCPSIFLIVSSTRTVRQNEEYGAIMEKALTPSFREEMVTGGANMVTSCVALVQLVEVVVKVVNESSSSSSSSSSFRCEYCGKLLPSAEKYWHHLPLFHVSSANIEAECAIWKKHTDNLQVHVHERHGSQRIAASSKSIYLFALAVVRRPSDGRFLVVCEL